MNHQQTKWQCILAWLLFSKARYTESALRRVVAGKIILVTGASYGVGEASACRLAQAGATVLLTGRTREKLEQVAEAIHASGGKAFVYPADLANAVSRSGFNPTHITHVNAIVLNKKGS